ncbi:hypothetical protein [Actinotalea sp. K2]|uniref:hypothetical protein n=1 Tax=Actinotalea sp. K2 TaxID=2939438 RepID=UPI002016BF2B|nr:hypothetical protein [Actinotalea sp. K2]MCL3860426.1 hypothetical protein [Actinotalea sp. K2]
MLVANPTRMPAPHPTRAHPNHAAVLTPAVSRPADLGLADRHGPVGTPPAQAGFFDDLLGTAVPGLLGAASSVLSGDGSGALSQVKATGAAAAPVLAEQGAGLLGGLLGGSAGQAVSSLGAPLGQGLSSVISGQSTPGEAAGGLLSAAQPALMSLLMSLLGR